VVVVEIVADAVVVVVVVARHRSVSYFDCYLHSRNYWNDEWDGMELHVDDAPAAAAVVVDDDDGGDDDLSQRYCCDYCDSVYRDCVTHYSVL
jgi:hypothetical protein